MYRKFRNILAIGQLILGSLMVIIGIVLLCTLPRTIQTQESLEKTLQHTAALSRSSAETMNASLKSSELASEALAEQTEALNKLGKKVPKTPSVLAKYLGDYSNYVVDFSKFIEQSIQSINDTTKGMTTSITNTQNLLNANAEAMTNIHAQFTAHKPLVYGTVIGAALFFGFGFIFILNAVFLIVCFPGKKAEAN